MRKTYRTTSSLYYNTDKVKKDELIANFDPNGPGHAGNIFGLPFTTETSEIVLIPVPWEATVTYGTGTSQAPKAILDASRQVDHYTRDIEQAWKLGVCMLPIPHEIVKESDHLRSLITPQVYSNTAGDHESNKVIVNKINEACENLNIFVKNTALHHLKDGKLVGLLGGDHSTTLGMLRALSERHERFGILQIDAHADLRKAYQGFTYSHASIMHNALKLPSINRLVQVGVRDYCDEEMQIISRAVGRIKTFFDDDIKTTLLEGNSWTGICDIIVKELPPLVYISFDIDGLDPKLCPNTGTPVPGGLEFHHITYLLKQLVKAGKKIIGFDLVEVGGGDWDANVGARILYQLCNWAGVSQGKLKLAE